MYDKLGAILRALPFIKEAISRLINREKADALNQVIVDFQQKIAQLGKINTEALRRAQLYLTQLKAVKDELESTKEFVAELNSLVEDLEDTLSNKDSYIIELEVANDDLRSKLDYLEKGLSDTGEVKQEG